MDQHIRIALIGDFNPTVTAHVAIPKALALAGKQTEGVWFDTAAIERCDEQELAGFNGFWAVPATPYHSMAGALRAIRFAREHRRPFLGTCGGFQHALIDFARNVLGLRDADHAESNPDATTLLVTPLRCALVEKTGTIHFKPGSRIAQIYGEASTIEQYHCSYGLNERYRAAIDASAMKITGWDVDRSVRVIELSDHPFFIATLFQPERSALQGRDNPLVNEFVQACAAHGLTEPLPKREEPG